MSKLDEIFRETFEYRVGQSKQQRLEDAKQAIKELFLELVGEDEMTPALARKLGRIGDNRAMAQFHNMNGKDETRHELRKKIEEL